MCIRDSTHPAATGQIDVVGGFKIVAAVILAQLCAETDRRYAVTGVVLSLIHILAVAIDIRKYLAKK